MYVFIIPQCIM